MSRLLHNLALIAWLSVMLAACGVPDNVEKAAVVTTQSISCADRNMILGKSESATFHFNLGGPGQLSPVLDTGNSLNYFDWGSMTRVDDTTVSYTSPAFIPEFRRIGLEGKLSSGASTAGSCFVYVLDDFTYGVTDDGNTRGLIVTSYLTTPTNDITKIELLPPKDKGVIRNLDFPSIPAGFTGVTSLLPTAQLVYRVTGTLNVPGGNYWFRLTAPNTSGSLMIDGLKRGASAIGLGGEMPLRSTSTSVTPNYNTGFPLAAGKHNIQIDLAHPANVVATFKLEWTNTKPNGTASVAATANAYTVIPPSAFDRD